MKQMNVGRRGFGLLAAVVILGFAVLLGATLTAALARMIDRTSRYAETVRARALAEAGIEAGLSALARTSGSGADLRLELEGGSCRVSIAKAGERVVITSVGQPSLSGRNVATTVVVEVAVGEAGAHRVMHRSERSSRLTPTRK